MFAIKNEKKICLRTRAARAREHPISHRRIKERPAPTRSATLKIKTKTQTNNPLSYTQNELIC